MNPPLASAIYEGWVRHRRHHPASTAFRYRLMQPCLDLAELDRVFADRWLWSVGRRNLAEFRRSDYFGDPRVPLDEAIRAHVTHRTGTRPAGPIRLLTQPAYFGRSFNPVKSWFFSEEKEEEESEDEGVAKKKKKTQTKKAAPKPKNK